MSSSIPKLSAEAEFLYWEAANYSFSWGKYPQNEKEAMRLLKKSASLGCIDAYLDMGGIYADGGPFNNSIFSGNYKKAIECYIRGGSMGSIWCYYEMAYIYAVYLNDEFNARKSFNLCAKKIIEKENGIGEWLDSDKMSTLTSFVIGSVPRALCGEQDNYRLSLFHNLFIEFSLVISDKVIEEYKEIVKGDINHELMPIFKIYKEYVKKNLPKVELTISRQVPVVPLVITQTLPELLAWLTTQNQVPLSVFRQKLLPLGLMPSALINDVNERAFDVAGEAALNEAADTVTVQRAVLLQVLAVW